MCTHNYSEYGWGIKGGCPGLTDHTQEDDSVCHIILVIFGRLLQYIHFVACIITQKELCWKVTLTCMHEANCVLFAMPQIHLLKHYQFIYGMIDYCGAPLHEHPWNDLL